jgi:hypothetical protein
MWRIKNNEKYKKMMSYFFIFFILLDFGVHFFEGGFEMAFYNLFWSCNVLAILLVIGF